FGPGLEEAPAQGLFARCSELAFGVAIEVRAGEIDDVAVGVALAAENVDGVGTTLGGRAEPVLAVAQGGKGLLGLRNLVFELFVGQRELNGTFADALLESGGGPVNGRALGNGRGVQPVEGALEFVEKGSPRLRVAGGRLGARDFEALLQSSNLLQEGIRWRH